MFAAQDSFASLKGRPAKSQGTMVAGLLATAVFLASGLIASPAMAQYRSSSDIVVNSDVLDSLGPGPAPLAPLAPALPPSAGGPAADAPLTFAPTPLTAAPLAPPPGFDSGGTAAPSQNGENIVVTRPGTLLFPPLQAPSSSLTPGFSPDLAQEQRKQAFENAFANGPEPSSQLLLPLADAESAAPADEGEWVFETVIIESRPSPQPAPRKPEPTPAMLAALQDAEEPGLQEALDQDLGPTALEPVETAELPADEQLAPEFREPTTVREAAPVVPQAPMGKNTGTAVAEMPAAPPSPAAEQMAVAEATPAAEAPLPAEAPENAQTREMAEIQESADRPADSMAPVSLLPESTATAPEMTPGPAPAETAMEVAARTETDDADRVPSPVEPRQQTASLPDPAALQDLSFTFAADSAELTTTAQAALQSFANDLRDMGEDRIQVLGYASGAEGSSDLDRQLALSRALKVRTFLIDAGIPSQRIQVRPPSGPSGGGPANRVDIKPIGS